MPGIWYSGARGADAETGVARDRERLHLLEQARAVETAIHLDVEADTAADDEALDAGL